MSLAPGTRLGPYEITGQIGAGGMGEVYRARDTKLDRAVAIKILPEAFAADTERIARFQREARTLASLNHPNIAHIHGLEDSDGVRALVMELVEGEDLAQRIARGAIPVAEALPIAKQMADALEAAHEQGIIHRDLKPANIKVRPDGTVKVLDFGLAKAMEPTGVASPSVSQSPTITTPAMTQAGMILGTAAYMSPEQARGKPVDKRADIWAFGVRALRDAHRTPCLRRRRYVSTTLAAVIMKEPDLAAVRPRTPHRRFGALLRRCLEKDPKRRLRDIGDARLELESASESGVVPPVQTLPRQRRWPWIAALLVVAIAASTFIVLLRLTARPSTQVVRFQVYPPPNGTFLSSTASGATVSPDGTRLVFPATGADGKPLLWLRPLDSVVAAPLAGTDDALWPFWSPDSRSVGFFTPSTLKKIDLNSRGVTVVATELSTPR